jgi:multiple sugar transport system permease protein
MKKSGKGFLKYLILAIVSLFMLIPLLAMVSTSLKYHGDVFATPFQWVPEQINWENYSAILAKHPFFTYFKNSLIVSVIATSFNLFLSSLAGYSLAKFHYKGKSLIFSVIIILLLMPALALIVPLFMIISSLNISNTLAAVIIPYLTSPFAVFLMRQYFFSIPDSVIEAARMDGASEFKIFFWIIVPQAKPVFITLGIFSFMFNWNNFLWPLIALNSSANFTLPLGIALMEGEYAVPYSELMAAATMASVPVLLVYLILQKSFIKGLTITNFTSKGTDTHQ